MAEAVQSITSWLWVPPDKTCSVRPPVETRAQSLPLNELSWENFQRLCARLAKCEADTEFAQEYGVQGQSQEGIDVYIRRKGSEKYAVWQCKRYQEMYPVTLRKAVDAFLAGQWATKSNEFGICVSVDTAQKSLADEIETQAQLLRAKGINFIALGVSELSLRLKNYPDLVEDFFGKEWLRVFCGEEAHTQRKKRILTSEQVTDLRHRLRNIYARHFECVDPGLPSLAASMSRPLASFPVCERFVLPDVIETQSYYDLRPVDTGRKNEEESSSESSVDEGSTGKQAAEPVKAVAGRREVRRPMQEWILENERAVIIGEPGIGKSAFLHYLVLDLLSPKPKHEKWALKWGLLLPVWIPFSMWVRITSENEVGAGLSDVVKGWLKNLCAPEDLLALVEQALEDSRLLLLVDGLDEWSDVTAARTTLTRLDHFVSDRNIPAIATCRPLGYERLGGLSNLWHAGTIAGLTEEQQRAVAEGWFLYRESVSSNEALDAESKQRIAVQAEQFVADVQRDGRLARMAAVPLLLSGLIALGIQGVQLPRSRFRAYEQLTQLLMEEQPTRREKAASERKTAWLISPPVREEAFSRLAYEIHKSPDSVAIKSTSAREHLKDFFERTLHKPPSEATQAAEHLLSLGAEKVGILVEKAQDELGLQHRALQEFLAAKHIASFPFPDQLKIVPSVVGDPLWNDVLVSLLYLNGRRNEVDELLGVIESAPIPLEAEPSRRTLLAEAAFADIRCSAPVASRIAGAIFEEIETGVWMPLRKRLLECALEGVYSDVLRDTVIQKLKRWYPSRHPRRSDVYGAMATWPRGPSIAEVLRRGLLDEDEWNQKSAAEALAKHLAGDERTAQQLLALLRSAADPRITAYTLHALALGWPEEPSIPDILKLARSSSELTLKTVATCHRVRRGEHDADDKAFLLALARDSLHGSYLWRDEAAMALAKGWPGDKTIKEAALKGLRERVVGRGPMDADYAVPFLLAAYPQDDEVAECIAAIFRNEEHPQHLFGIGRPWASMAAAFGGHPRLRDAIDDWFETVAPKTFDEGACLVSGSERAKRALMALPCTPTIWGGTKSVRTLIEGWGVADKEVIAHLDSVASREDMRPFIADILPKITKDKDACRKELLGYLRTQQEWVADYALEGLAELGSDGNDEEVVEAALDKWCAKVPSGMAWAGVNILIERFHKHPRVRELACHQVANRDGSIGRVARAYADDAEIRAALVNSLGSLPAALRLIVVEWMSRQPAEDGVLHELLRDFDQDHEVNVKTAGAIAYSRSVMRRGDEREALIRVLSDTITVTGPDHEERRGAAFAGLLELDRCDVAATAKEHDGKPARVTVGDSLRPNRQLARQFIKRWSSIQAAFGNSFWTRSHWLSDPFLEEMASLAQDSVIQAALLEYSSQSHKDGEIPVWALRVMERRWKGADQLEATCLKMVQGFRHASWDRVAAGLVAAEILGRQFGKDDQLRQAIEAAVFTADDPSAAVVALCCGWPTSEALNALAKDNDRRKRILTPAAVYFTSLRSSAEDFVSKVSDWLPRISGGIWEFLPICVSAIQSRFTRDKPTADVAFLRLEAKPSVEMKTSLPPLLRDVRGGSKRLQDWCRAELTRQSSMPLLQEVGIDITNGSIRPVAHVLWETLSYSG